MSISAAAALLPDAIDALLIVSPENRFYLTGFSSSDGVLLVTKRGSVFFTDSRYLEAARAKIAGCPVRDVTDFSASLRQECADKCVSRVAIESMRMSVHELNRYREILPEAEFVCDGTADGLLNSMRMKKSRGELLLIKKAQGIAQAAFEHILGFIKPGVTEKEVALELDYFMLRNGADALSFETIAVSGANSSMPHGVPGSKKISCGDFVTMDFGAVVDGYHSDMTRTIAVGFVSEEQREIYSTVLFAQQAALSVLRPGVSCKVADAAARDVISEAGFGEFFGHGTGHGVGVEIHEQPNLSPKSECNLEEGNVVTVEPGIYIPGRFGVRIEDMAVITADSYENLTVSPKNLIII